MTREELKNLMKPLIKKAAKMTLKRYIPNSSLPIPHSLFPEGTELQSHFGGQPYFEKGEQWPQAKNGNNLVFVFQAFNDGNMGLPENIKLIQFYYDYEEKGDCHLFSSPCTPRENSQKIFIQ